MNARMWLTNGFWIALGCLILGLFFGQPSVGQAPAVPPAAAGRYQMTVGGSPGASTVFVCDTQTGQCWYRQTLPQIKDWTDMGSPAGDAAK